MHATWIWCIAKTMAVAPQRRPSSKQAAAIVLERDAAPAELVGHEGRQRPRLAQRIDGLDREARLAVDVVGVRAPRPRRRSGGCRRGTPGRDRWRCSCRHRPERLEGLRDRGDALEDAALEHRVRELDVEAVLEGEHQVDARVRGHARLVEVGVVAQRVDVHGQAAMFLDDLTNLVAPARPPKRKEKKPPAPPRPGGTKDGRAGANTPKYLLGGGGPKHPPQRPPPRRRGGGGGRGGGIAVLPPGVGLASGSGGGGGEDPPHPPPGPTPSAPLHKEGGRLPDGRRHRSGTAGGALRGQGGDAQGPAGRRRGRAVAGHRGAARSIRAGPPRAARSGGGARGPGDHHRPVPQPDPRGRIRGRGRGRRVSETSRPRVLGRRPWRRGEPRRLPR